MSDFCGSLSQNSSVIRYAEVYFRKSIADFSDVDFSEQPSISRNDP